MHALEHDYSESKTVAHKGTFMLLFTRQSGGQRVYQAKIVKTHSNNLVMLTQALCASNS